jgi:L-lactate dehydrogenase complex protein LldE
MQVEVFIPCFIDQFYPETAANFVRLLEKAGCETHYNPKQTCCGQPAYNSGYWDEARTVARKFIEDFTGERLVIAPSASCTGFVRNYYHKLFEGDKKLDAANELRKRVFEFSDFVVNHLKFFDFGATFPHRVTFHDSCAGLREYGINEEPRKLMGKVNGLELIEMEKRDVCCGFGGTFMAKFHHISAAMTEQKVESAMKVGAEYIVSTEASCLMNLDAYIKKQKLPIKTIHLVDLLVQGSK